MNELKIIIGLSLVLISGLFINEAFAVPTSDILYGCESNNGDREIHKMHKQNGTTISSATMTLAGFTVDGCSGLAVDPTDGTFYSIIRTVEDGFGDRRLVTIIPSTGVMTSIGLTGDIFSGFAIKADGSLRGVVGHAGSSPEQYHAINKTTGATTLLCTLTPSASFEGMALALNQDDGKMYFMTGLINSGAKERLSTIDNEGTCSQTSVIPSMPLNVSHPDEVKGLSYNTDDGRFYATGRGSNAPTKDYWDMFANGTMALLNPSNYNADDIKGLAFQLPDAPPVISAISGEDPVILNEGQAFNIFIEVQCIDVVDGAIVPNGLFSTVSGTTVDPDVVGLQTQQYTCTDSSTNNVITDIDYLVKRADSGGGASFDAGTSGGQQSVSKLSDVAPVIQPTTPPTDVDRALSFFDQLNSFFDFDRAEEEVTAPIAPTAPIPEPDQRESFVDRIRDFFASLFG